MAETYASAVTKAPSGLFPDGALVGEYFTAKPVSRAVPFFRRFPASLSHRRQSRRRRDLRRNLHSRRIDRVVVFVNQLRDGDDLVPLRLQRLKNGGQRGRRIFRAVVEQDDRARFHTREHAVRDLLRRRVLPVERIILLDTKAKLFPSCINNNHQ